MSWQFHFIFQRELLSFSKDVLVDAVDIGNGKWKGLGGI